MRKFITVGIILNIIFLLITGCSNTKNIITTETQKSDPAISGTLDLYKIWERDGYPDDIGGLFSIDGSADNAAFLIVNPTQERIDELSSLIGSELIYYPSKYSYNELRQLQAEITTNHMEDDGKKYGVGVGWSSGVGFGESEKEFRVFVVVDENEYGIYRDMFLQLYGDKVFVETGGPYLPMNEDTQTEENHFYNIEQKPGANFGKYTGYYLRSTENDFFIADGDSLMFTDKEPVRIVPVYESWDPDAERVSFDSLNDGDKIIIKILTVGDLNPRITQVYSYSVLEQGDISNIDESVITLLNDLGFYVIETGDSGQSFEKR